MKNETKIIVTLSERPEGEHGWQADCGDQHGIGLTKREALVNLAGAIDRAEWEARPEPKVCLTCGIFGGHVPDCKDDPNPKATARRKAR